MILRLTLALQIDSKLPAQSEHRQVWLILLSENAYMNRKLTHWATLTGKNNHCNNNCSRVMIPRRTVAVFSVAMHVSPWQPFL